MGGEGCRMHNWNMIEWGEGCHHWVGGKGAMCIIGTSMYYAFYFSLALFVCFSNRLEAFVCDLVSKAPEVCCRQEFGAKVWNCSHYIVIEAMRKQVQEASCVPGKFTSLCVCTGTCSVQCSGR